MYNNQVTWREANVFASLYVFFRSAPLFFLLATMSVYLSVLFGQPSVLVLFFKHRYNWHEDTIGYITSTISGCRGLGLAIGLPVALHLTRKWENRYYLLSQFSCLCLIANCLLWALVDDPVWTFVITTINLFTSWTIPLVRAICSAMLDAREQGLLFGAIAVIEACISPLVGVSIINRVYSRTVDTEAGTFLFVSAGLVLFTFFTMLAYFLSRPQDHSFRVDALNH